ncbi:DUF1772 domain-containing protein [Aliihoeflea sp. PC F10.4]
MTQPISHLALVLIAITMGLAVAHALEYPGKMRLDEEAYRTVQAIYYPGFTVGGLVAELGGILVLCGLLFLIPTGSERFWWTVGSLGLMLLLHATYWVWTHPVNGFWLQDTELSGAGSSFFSIFTGENRDWRGLRDIWEYSHMARAVLGVASLLSMSIALTKPL